MNNEYFLVIEFLFLKEFQKNVIDKLVIINADFNNKYFIFLGTSLIIVSETISIYSIFYFANHADLKFRI